MLAWHLWMAVYHWLELQGLYRSVVGGVVGFMLARTLGWRPRKHAQDQARLIDQLDTTTPGGLGELTRLLEALLGPDDEPEAAEGGDDDGDPGQRKRGHHRDAFEVPRHEARPDPLVMPEHHSR